MTFEMMKKQVLQALDNVSDVEVNAIGPVSVTVAKAVGGNNSISFQSFLRSINDLMDTNTLDTALDYLLEHGIKSSISDVIDRYSLKISLDQFDQAINEFVLNRSFETAHAVMTRLTDVVREVVQSGFDAGLALNKIKETVTDAFNSIVDYEAKRIGRTEATTVYNWGRFTSFLAGGVETKIWLTAADEKVRDTHITQHGMEIPIADQFPNGLLYPGDPAGTAKEVINCRCIIVPGVINQAAQAA